MKINTSKLNEFGTYILVKALENCSEDTTEEVKEELEKLVEEL